MNGQEQVQCTACGQGVRPNATACGYCGHEVADSDVTLMRPHARPPIADQVRTPVLDTEVTQMRRREESPLIPPSAAPPAPSAPIVPEPSTSSEEQQPAPFPVVATPSGRAAMQLP
jgi:hypothetical protein